MSSPTLYASTTQHTTQTTQHYDYCNRSWLIESAVYSANHAFAGTCDWIGELDGAPTLCDWKSSRLPKFSRASLGAYPLQIAAYWGAVREMYGRCSFLQYVFVTVWTGTGVMQRTSRALRLLWGIRVEGLPVCTSSRRRSCSCCMSSLSCCGSCLPTNTTPTAA